MRAQRDFHQSVVFRLHVQLEDFLPAGHDFWLIEEVNGRPAVFVYELDPVTKSYAISGAHHDRLKISVPFDIDIDLTTLYKSRTR